MAGKPQPDKSRTRETLDDLARRRGITSAELAQLSGINPPQVHHDRSGHRKISAERLAAYCLAFGPSDKIDLVRAWLADTLPPDLFQWVEVKLSPKKGEQGTSVSRGASTAPQGLRDDLDRLADACVQDRDLLKAVRQIVSRLVSPTDATTGPKQGPTKSGKSVRRSNTTPKK